ncbi:MAG TPA: molybdate ABC transporter substrate-binding protein [Cellulomonas sp.]|uniref:molybdate ABC transporter substrate-binding protein n=1 Tax=Cellulomonas sp. TaxID=40001 RepID=UPI002E32CA6A|nr:molybdate ABC transporter substrate-binding protein [Cellulomonas sp.]HEX5332986.1 molybdate ABC transporter substrate-binding protein [Cellulomonas sp.]
MRRPVLATLIAAAAASALLAGCGAPAAGDAASAAGTEPGSATTPAVAGEITVLAAASLTEAFTTLGRQFEAAHPGASITFSFGPSSGLATQITEGAPVDVFASASTATMDDVVAAGAAAAPAVFADNVMEIAVPASNPAGVTALADLARPEVKVALCQPAVPCGAGAASVLAAAGLTVTPVTLEADVKATLTKVVLGEVDAGVVYATDVLAAGDTVTGIEIPADVNAATSYPIASLAASKNPHLAKAFVDYVLSGDGASVLTAAGFRRP